MSKLKHLLWGHLEERVVLVGIVLRDSHLLRHHHTLTCDPSVVILLIQHLHFVFAHERLALGHWHRPDIKSVRLILFFVRLRPKLLNPNRLRVLIESCLPNRSHG